MISISSDIAPTTPEFQTLHAIFDRLNDGQLYTLHIYCSPRSQDNPWFKEKKQEAVDFPKLFNGGMEFEQIEQRAGSVLLFPNEKRN